LGKVGPGTVNEAVKTISPEEAARLERVENKPSLDEILNLHDFEVWNLHGAQGRVR
jgi:L-lactate dehydrogenase (cytochrome)